ncbi:MAG TPA: hypothetical protein VF168_02380 [Trueperaceae bacterium]
MRYILSALALDSEQEERLAEVRGLIQQRIDREGRVRITKSTGLIIASA